MGAEPDIRYKDTMKKKSKVRILFPGSLFPYGKLGPMLPLVVKLGPMLPLMF